MLTLAGVAMSGAALGRLEAAERRPSDTKPGPRSKAHQARAAAAVCLADFEPLAKERLSHFAYESRCSVRKCRIPSCSRAPRVIAFRIPKAKSPPRGEPATPARLLLSRAFRRDGWKTSRPRRSRRYGFSYTICARNAVSLFAAW
jgi:hypothetical protein